MRNSTLFAALMLVVGVAYVVDAVALRARVGPLVAGAPTAPPVGIPVVRTWGQLLEQPAVDLPDGRRVHVGIASDAVPGRGGVLLYVLAEADTLARRPGQPSLRLVSTPVRPGEAPGQEMLAAEAALFLWPDDTDEADGEDRPAPIRHRLYVWSVVGNPGAEAWRVRLWNTADGDGRRGFVVAEAVVGVGAPLDPPWLTLRPANGIDAPFAAGPWAVPAFEGMRPFETAEPGEALRQRPLPALIPDRPTAGFDLTPREGGFVVSSTRPIQITWPDDSLLVRYTVNGRRPAVAEPRLEDQARSGSTRLGNAVDVALDFAALGAGPGDELTVEVLWCPDGHASGLDLARLVMGTMPGAPRGALRSNRITLRVP